MLLRKEGEKFQTNVPGENLQQKPYKRNKHKSKQSTDLKNKSKLYEHIRV